MEVRKGYVCPQGYKQTEVGVIPEDWDVGVIADLAIKVGSGITPTGGEKVYKNEGRPFIRSQNVGWGNLLLDDIAFIDEETHSTFPATEIKLNDVLLNITGASIGRSAVADKRIEKGNVNQHVCIIRVDENKLAPHYINLFLLSNMGQKQIDSFQAGGNRQGLNFGQIKSFQFPLPPLPEQQAIAAALSDVDSLLTALDALIAKKRLIKQGAMQELLTGKRRLSGFDGDRKLVRLGDVSFITDFSANGSFADLRENVQYLSRPDYAVLVRLADFSHNWNGDFVYLPKHSYDFLKKCQLEIGDVIIANIGANAGTLFRVPNLGKPMVLGPNALVIKTNEHPQTSKEYLYYYLSSPDGQKSVKNIIASSAQPKFNKTDIRNLTIPLPSLVEQNAIAEILSDMDAEINALEARRHKTALVKQGMMSELLTGRIRLNRD